MLFYLCEKIYVALHRTCVMKPVQIGIADQESVLITSPQALMGKEISKESCNPMSILKNSFSY